MSKRFEEFIKPYFAPKSYEFRSHKKGAGKDQTDERLLIDAIIVGGDSEKLFKGDPEDSQKAGGTNSGDFTLSSLAGVEDQGDPQNQKDITTYDNDPNEIISLSGKKGAEDKMKLLVLK